MLGTVQFGMPYGIANRSGQPDYGTVRAILAAAAEAGVNCLDTTAAYGASEEVIGRALEELGLADRMVVVTKVDPARPSDIADSAAAARRAITDSVARSLQRLRMESLPIVLFHREEDAARIETLLELKDKGLVRHVGVSCGNQPGPPRAILVAGQAEALQLPVNLLDRRHVDSGILGAAAAKGVATFVRSVYLQGLLLMPEKSVPDELSAIISPQQRLEKIAAEAGMRLAELAVRYVLALEGVTCVLTGVETLDQLRSNVALFERGPLDAALMRAVAAAVPDLPEAVITPWMWKHKPAASAPRSGGEGKPMLVRAHERVEELIGGYQSPVPGDIQEDLSKHFHDLYAAARSNREGQVS